MCVFIYFCTQLIPLDQLLRLLRHKPISPERLAGIFDRLFIF